MKDNSRRYASHLNGKSFSRVPRERQELETGFDILRAWFSDAVRNHDVIPHELAQNDEARESRIAQYERNVERGFNPFGTEIESSDSFDSADVA